MHAAAGRRRAGFTLVELLVAIGLAIVITAVTVAVLNTGVIESQRVISSADRVSGWLITAKNRAKRDGRPRGVRFFRSATDANLLTEAEYIETPVPYNPNPTAAINGGRIVFVYGTDANGVVNARWAYYVNDTPANLLGEFDQQVAVGDLMYVPEFGTSYKLLAAPGALPLNASSNAPYAFPQATVQVGPTAPGAPNARLLTLSSYPDLGAAHSPPIPSGASPPPQACYTTYGFSFQKTPRPLFGEPLLQLSPDAVIDARNRISPPLGSEKVTSLNVTNPSTTPGDFDVLFAPSGQVLNQTVGLLAFLVRDPNKPEGIPLSLDPYSDFDNAGQMALVAVYTKTGAVATHPVVSAATPFQAAKDGVNAGF